MAIVKHTVLRNTPLTTRFGTLNVSSEGVVTQNDSAEIPSQIAAYLMGVPGFYIDRIVIKSSKPAVPEIKEEEPEPEPIPSQPETVTQEIQEPEEEVQKKVDYESLSLAQLKALARQRGIEFARNATKVKMVELLT